MAIFEEYAQKLDFRGLMITSVITALGITVGLFWQDAISQTINQLLPQEEGLFYKYVAAVAVTILLGVIAYALMKWQESQIKTKITR
ncbi:MAG: hypothetical protein HY364_03570 [Candidatus Aenigmarchaeota archaeon]|nr:hypothetical protein [Candidatus Aenigmarchaeota archaeon]